MSRADLETTLRRDGARRWRRLWPWLLPPFLLAAATVSIVASSGSMGGSSPTPTINLPQDVGIDQKLGAEIPRVAVFRDEQGRELRLEQLLNGKPIILALVYLRCPMLCNMTMDGLVRGLRDLRLSAGQDYDVWTVSFDAREKPELAAAAKKTALARYGRDSADDSWHFLTGEEDSIRQLTTAVGFRYRYDPDQDQFAHAAGLMVLTPRGTVASYLNGVQFPAGQLRVALSDAAEGRARSLGDRVLLLCYHYDPATGKYGLAIVRLLRLAALATVLSLVGGIVWLLRRERAARRRDALRPTNTAQSHPDAPILSSHGPPSV